MGKYLGIAAALVVALLVSHYATYQWGAADEATEWERSQKDAISQAVEDAQKEWKAQAAADAAIAQEATAAVATDREAGESRRADIEDADLTPTHYIQERKPDDPITCPDNFADPFASLWESDGGGNSAGSPAPEPTDGVPGRD